MSSSFDTIFKTLGQQLLSDVEGTSKGLLVGFFTNIKANPTPQNVIAQGALLQAAALLSGPNLEQAAISQLADDGLSLTNSIPAPAAGGTGAGAAS